MAYIVELYRDRNEEGFVIIEWRCALWEWNRLQEIGIENGWNPLGTIVLEADNASNYTNDYFPPYPGAKRVIAQDAVTWANALKKIDAKIPGTDPNETIINVNGPSLLISNEDGISGFQPGISRKRLKKLIAFMEKGEFEFWVDD